MLSMTSVGTLTRREKHVERGNLVVERRTFNRERPGLNLLCYSFEVWEFAFSTRRPRSPWLQFTQLYK